MKLYAAHDCELTVVADLGAKEPLTTKRIAMARRFARKRDAVFVEVWRWSRMVRLMLAVDVDKVG